MQVEVVVNIILVLLHRKGEDLSKRKDGLYLSTVRGDQVRSLAIISQQ